MSFYCFFIKSYSYLLFESMNKDHDGDAQVERCCETL